MSVQFSGDALLDKDLSLDDLLKGVDKDECTKTRRTKLQKKLDMVRTPATKTEVEWITLALAGTANFGFGVVVGEGGGGKEAGEREEEAGRGGKKAEADGRGRRTWRVAGSCRASRPHWVCRMEQEQGRMGCTGGAPRPEPMCRGHHGERGDHRDRLGQFEPRRW